MNTGFEEDQQNLDLMPDRTHNDAPRSERCEQLLVNLDLMEAHNLIKGTSKQGNQSKRKSVSHIRETKAPTC